MRVKVADEDDDDDDEDHEEVVKLHLTRWKFYVVPCPQHFFFCQFNIFVFFFFTHWNLVAYLSSSSEFLVCILCCGNIFNRANVSHQVVVYLSSSAVLVVVIRLFRKVNNKYVWRKCFNMFADIQGEKFKMISPLTLVATVCHGKVCQ